MQYRRSRAKGAAFFFTVVTHGRRRFLCDEASIALIREAFQQVINRHPFTVEAFVLLPDHLHGACKGDQLAARPVPGKQAIWQHRFWEHQIRDENDFVNHVEYIHFNPVKHGLAISPAAWPHSTFHRFVKQEIYLGDWGAEKEIDFEQDVGNE